MLIRKHTEIKLDRNIIILNNSKYNMECSVGDKDIHLHLCGTNRGLNIDILDSTIISINKMCNTDVFNNIHRKYKTIMRYLISIDIYSEDNIIITDSTKIEDKYYMNKVVKQEKSLSRFV